MKYLLYLCFLFFALEPFDNLKAQTPPDSISGLAFRNWIKENFYDQKQHSLGYDSARIYMYGFVDNKNGKLTGVYSGFTKNLPYGSITTYPDPINCEHSIPQSWFSKESVKRSDMFHLFPTYQNWNSKRGSLPFADIPDQSVDEWFKDDQSYTTQPNSNLDQYSRLKTNVSFEPRLEHKGDLARAAFYFYTMYPNVEGGLSRLGDPDIFLKWHAMDPVSESEKDRNNAIQKYQKNRNPFIDHPEWVSKAWDLDDQNKPSTPQNFNLNTDNNIAELTWDDVANESGYIVFRSIDEVNFIEYDRLPENATLFLDTLGTSDTYCYYLKSWNYFGTAQNTATLSYTFTAIINSEGINHSDQYLVDVDIFPNPFNSVARIVMDVQKSSEYQIIIYNSSGQIVYTLVNGWLSEGKNSFFWKPQGLSSGVYFISVAGAGSRKVFKSYLLK